MATEKTSKNMMRGQVIKIEDALAISERKIGERHIYAIDARKVWEWLEVESQYTHWIERRINQYGFVIGIDYTLVKFDERSFGSGIKNTEYYVSIDMAKQLCMVENNERGREARLHFIRAEEELRRVKSSKDIIATFIRSELDYKTKSLYPREIYVEYCRVYGLPKPDGTQHSPACRGFTTDYIVAALPVDVQSYLFDVEINPYSTDGKTRRDKHWRRVNRMQPVGDTGKEIDILDTRINDVLTILRTCGDCEREEFKRAIAAHDRRKKIVLKVSKRIKAALRGIHAVQYTLFDLDNIPYQAS